MKVQLNGQNLLLSKSIRLADVLNEHFIGQQTAGIAVAVNGQIAFRSNWSSIRLKEGDQIEIVHAVSGG